MLQFQADFSFCSAPGGKGNSITSRADLLRLARAVLSQHALEMGLRQRLHHSLEGGCQLSLTEALSSFLTPSLTRITSRNAAPLMAFVMYDWLCTYGTFHTVQMDSGFFSDAFTNVNTRASCECSLKSMAVYVKVLKAKNFPPLVS